MENLLRELINSVNNLNSFSWNDFINNTRLNRIVDNNSFSSY